MLSALAPLLDIGALVTVFAGTWLATAARSGSGDLANAARALAGLGQARFDENANRAELARGALLIRQRGPLCAEITLPRDPSLAKAVARYVATGSIETLQDVAHEKRIERVASRTRGQLVFEYAGELAPVFGLVGTLFAISPLNPDPALGSTETIMASVATAADRHLPMAVVAQEQAMTLCHTEDLIVSTAAGRSPLGAQEQSLLSSHPRRHKTSSQGRHFQRSEILFSS